MNNLLEVRLRTVIATADLEAVKGKIVTDGDYNLLVTGPTKLVKPNGQPLAIYLPGVLTHLMDDAYDVLHSLRNERTDNRGMASGTPRAKRGAQTRTRSSLVASAIIGAVDPGGIYPFCRLTSWTGAHLAEWQSLAPLLQAIDGHLQEHVPDRWAAQWKKANLVQPEWMVPGTTFSTITVNNSYSTGVHQDTGDLADGFSTLAVASRGDYTGGTLVFPRYRVGIDARHGDLILLDAHEWHGNTTMVPADPDAQRMIDYERISLVAYLRESMTTCGTVDEEQAKARVYADRRSGLPTP